MIYTNGKCWELEKNGSDEKLSKQGKYFETVASAHNTQKKWHISIFFCTFLGTRCSVSACGFFH